MKPKRKPQPPPDAQVAKAINDAVLCAQELSRAKIANLEKQVAELTTHNEALLRRNNAFVPIAVRLYDAMETAEVQISAIKNIALTYLNELQTADVKAFLEARNGK